MRNCVCTVSWTNAPKYNMVPKIKRKQAYFHDESTFFKAFQLKLEDNLFFSWGLRPFWDFLAWERPLGLSKAKKIPKRPKADRKKQIVWELKLKSLKKSWQIMKINLLSFYLRSHIVFTRICPWIQFFTLLDDFLSV